jgi:hypothetical protein
VRQYFQVGLPRVLKASLYEALRDADLRFPT